jgi:hypothetical protein
MHLLSAHKRTVLSVAVLTCLVLASLVWSASASLRGTLVARLDIAQGHYQELGFGLPVPWRDDYARLLQNRYGIQFRAVAGCVVSPEEVAYVEAYNRESTAAAQRKFGRNVFEEAEKEARETWERSIESYSF